MWALSRHADAALEIVGQLPVQGHPIAHPQHQTAFVGREHQVAHPEFHPAQRHRKTIHVHHYDRLARKLLQKTGLAMGHGIFFENLEQRIGPRLLNALIGNDDRIERRPDLHRRLRVVRRNRDQ